MPYCYKYNKAGNKKTYYKIDNGNMSRISIKKLKSEGINLSSIDNICTSSDNSSDMKQIPTDPARNISKHKHEYITFQKDVMLPFTQYNGLDYNYIPDGSFKNFLDDTVSLLGVVRLVDKISSSDTYHRNLEEFLNIIMGPRLHSKICRGYRNYYGYSPNDIKLFPNYLKAFESYKLPRYYIPDVPDNNHIGALENISTRKYINFNNIEKVKGLQNDAAITYNNCLEGEFKYDYSLLTLRFHIEPILEIPEGKIQTVMLLIDLKELHNNKKKVGYFIDIFGDRDNDSKYNIFATSSLVDLTYIKGMPLFFSVYNNINIPTSIQEHNPDLKNIWNWFLLSLEILNNDIARVLILKKLNMINNINKSRLIHQFMYYIYQSYGHETIKKYMMKGISEPPIKDLNKHNIKEIWKNAYDI